MNKIYILQRRSGDYYGPEWHCELFFVSPEAAHSWMLANLEKYARDNYYFYTPDNWQVIEQEVIGGE